MGTLKNKWGPNGDPKSEKGPHGDPGPQMGTHVGAVHKIHDISLKSWIPMSGGLERARARKVRACVHALNNFHIFFSTCIVSPYIGKTRSVEKSWRRKQETPKNGQMATVWVKMSERVKRKRSRKLLVRAHYARTSKNFFCTCQRGRGGR